MDWSLLVNDPRYEWITTREAARRLRDELNVTVSPRYLRDSARKGRLPGFALDGMWYVDWLTVRRRYADAISGAGFADE